MCVEKRNYSRSLNSLFLFQSLSMRLSFHPLICWFVRVSNFNYVKSTPMSLSYSLISCNQPSTKPKYSVRWHLVVYTFNKTGEERTHSSSLLWRDLTPLYILNLLDCNKGLGKGVYWSYQRQKEFIGCPKAFWPARSLTRTCHQVKQYVIFTSFL